MPIDFDFPADVIADMLTGTYVVTRRTTGMIANGLGLPGGTSTFEMDAGIHPADARTLLRLPEERRTTETRMVFTVTRLLVGGQGKPNEADLILVDDQQWEVQSVEPWAGFFKATIQAVEL